MLARLVALGGALLVAVAAASPARASYAEDAISALNAQRTANGIPAGIVEVPEWSRGCELHMNYLSVNDETGHDEDPAKPGYTPEGAWAGGSAVLSWGGEDWPENPWELAPIHLAQVLHPALALTGVARGCLTTWPGYARPAPEQTVVHTYPGPGRTDVRFEESTGERPFAPVDLLGLENPTGPHLYVFPWGPSPGRVAAAQVTGPDGPVALRIADGDTTDGTRRIGGYLPGDTAMLIPVAPLRPDADYSASVTFTGGLSHTWGFRTAVRDNHVEVALGSGDGGRAKVYVESDAPAVEAWSVDPAGQRQPLALTPRRRGPLVATLGGRPGRWRVCARSGGPGTGFKAAESCATERIAQRWSLTVTRRGRSLRIRAHEYTAGRSVSVLAQHARYGCRPLGPLKECGDMLSGRTMRRVVRPSPVARLRLPRWAVGRRNIVWVDVRVARGTAYGVRVPALHDSRRVDSGKR